MTDLRDWAKLDTEWYDDTDLLAAAEDASAAFVMWPVLIAKAKAASHMTRNPDGTLRVTPSKLAFEARIDIADVGPALDALGAHDKIRFVEECANKLSITLTGFAKWQRPRGSNADKQQRKNGKNGLISAKDDTTVTPPRHPDNTAATPPRHPDVDIDVDRDKEITITSETSSDHTFARELFDLWLDETGRNKNQNRLTKKRVGLVRGRRRDGYTQDDLRAAVKGIASSPWHAGENPNGTRYDTFDFIFRSGENVEKGIERAQGPTQVAALQNAGVGVSVLSANALVRIEEMIRRSLTAEEEAELTSGLRSPVEFLAEHGITVEAAGAA